MSGQLHHDLLNLINSLSSVHFNVLMLTSQRGGKELRDKTLSLCENLDSNSEELNSLKKEILDLLKRTENDGDLVASELERMDKTITQIKELMPEVHARLKGKPMPA